jgi:hypothetical protein
MVTWMGSWILGPLKAIMPIVTEKPNGLTIGLATAGGLPSRSSPAWACTFIGR